MLRSEKSKGFMLLEVILSVLIIAAGFIFIIRSYSTSMKAGDTARALSKACLFLEERLFELEVEGFTSGVAEGEEGGAVEGEAPYTWNSNIAVLDEKAERPLNKVNLDMVWTKGSQRKRIGVSTFLKYKKE